MNPQDAARDARNAAGRASWAARRAQQVRRRAALVARWEPPSRLPAAQRAAVLAAHQAGTLTLGAPS